MLNEITITKDAGDYYCSIIYDNGIQLPEKEELAVENSICIDLVIEKFATLSATLSNCIAIKNTRFIDNVDNRINKLQRQLSKKQKGSNRKKVILKLQKKYRKMRNMHEYFLDKVSTAIAKQYDTIIIEDLNVQVII